MTIAQQTIEARGADVEEAIQEGLAELNLERDAVEVQVLDEGSSGFLGIGGRDAVVRLTVKPAHRGQTEKASPEASASAAARQSLMAALTEAEVSPETSDTSAQDVPEEDDEPAEREIAKEIVETLLARMQVEADVSLSQTEPDDLTGERRWIVNVHGEDMGALIGPRGETLNALQYIARLMTGHVTHRRPSFIVDVEGYRARREQALARLAERMAAKALKRGQPVTLEPMPANERRIIHITLRDDERVHTESSGEGPKRRVRIFPQYQD